MKKNNNLENLTSTEKNNWPATLYVEGQDQFRGWFNSSLITSVILTNKSPYQQVLSHGFVVDEEGHKMSKSLGNIIDPEDIIKNFGTDVLRLWVVSSDFTKEIKISISALENIQESYQKIRNTLRFLLGNLANLPTEIKSEENLETNLNIVDYYILHQLEKLTGESKKNYNEYKFNLIYSSLLNFCINNLSSFYFEISKDNLYCDNLISLRRKQITTTLYHLLWRLLKIISPILPHLAEEIYQKIPFRFGFANRESVNLVNYPSELSFSPSIEKKIELITDFLLPLRQNIFSLLEKARYKKIIDTNSQASLLICLKKKEKIDYSELNLAELLLVAKVKFSEKKENNMQENQFCFVKVEKSNKEKCIRCWNYRELKQNICSRCQKVLSI